MEVVGQPPRIPDSNRDHPPKSPGRNSFFIQDILSPEFGNRQLKEQYYAYLHYYYSLHMHNMILLRNQHQLQQHLQKDHKLDEELTSGQFDPRKIAAQDHATAVIRPIPRNFVATAAGGKTVLHTAPFLADHSPQIVLKPMTVFAGEKNAMGHHDLSSSNVGSTDSRQHRHGKDLGMERLCNKDKRELATDYNKSGEKKESLKRDNEVLDRTDSGEGVAKSCGTASEDGQDGGTNPTEDGKSLWPAWVYCTRYSDRPSSGPRSRKIKRKSGDNTSTVSTTPCSMMEKRPRIAFTNEQLARLKREFDENRYLTEERRAKLASELDLTESQVKIWFQNKRAKLKKSCGSRNPLAIQLMQQGLYNHATVPMDDQD